MKLVAKMKVESVLHAESQETLKVLPVTGDSEENKQWSRWTPGGLLELWISNPDARGFFKPGDVLRVTLEKFLVVVGLLAVALALLAPAPALAADAAPAPSTGGAILSFVLQYVLPPLVPVLGGLVTWALAKLVTFLDAKAKESKAALVAAKLTGAAQSVVADLNATLRPQLEAALADGVLTDVEKKQLKEAALTTLKTKLPPTLMASASSIFGGFLDTYLSGAVERAVLDQKATAAVGRVGPPTP